MKNDPIMMSGMKYIQFHALPDASLLWNTQTHTQGSQRLVPDFICPAHFLFTLCISWVGKFIVVLLSKKINAALNVQATPTTMFHRCAGMLWIMGSPHLALAITLIALTCLVLLGYSFCKTVIWLFSLEHWCLCSTSVNNSLWEIHTCILKAVFNL